MLFAERYIATMYLCQIKHDDKISGLLTPSGHIQKTGLSILSELIGLKAADINKAI